MKRLLLLIAAVLAAGGLVGLVVDRLNANLLQVPFTTSGGGTLPVSTGAPILSVSGGIPSNITLPTLTGSTTVGSVQTCTTHVGDWTNSPTTYNYQFLREGSTTGMPAATGPISATFSTYTIVTADQGHNLTCTVIAASGSGSSTAATSNSVNIPATCGVSTTTIATVGTQGTFTGAQSGTSYSASYTMTGPASCNNALVVLMSEGQSSHSTFTGVTYAGVACSLAGSGSFNSAASNMAMAVCPLNAIAPGAHTLAWNNTAAPSSTISGCVMEYTGVAQTSAIEGANGATGNPYSQSATVTTGALVATGDWLIAGVLSVGGAGSPTLGGGLDPTNGNRNHNAAACNADVWAFILDSNGTVATGAKTPTVTWTGTNTPWSMVAFGLKHG